jgi:hypothetical protein
MQIIKTIMTNKSHLNHKLPLQARSATLELFAEGSAEGVTTDLSAAEPSSVFSIVFSTGERVRRCDVFNDVIYDEELIIGSSSIRVARLNSGAPVLDTHEQTTLSNVIGVVVPGSVRIENGIARAFIKLDSGPENSSTIRKIRDGIIRNVSVGYVVHKFEVVCEDDNSVPLYRATDWEPYEISLVPIGADSGAGIRSIPTTWPCEIIRTNNFNSNLTKTFMTDTNSQAIHDTTTNGPTNFDFKSTTEPMTDTFEDDIPTTTDDTSTTDVALSGDDVNFASTEDIAPIKRGATYVGTPADFAQKDVIKLERNRVLEIQKIVHLAKLPDSLSRSFIEKGTSLNNVRKILFEKLAKESESNQVTSTRIVRDEVDSRRSLIENALLHRYNPNKHKLDPSAREFRGLSLMEIGIEVLESRGIKTRGLARTQKVDRMLGMETRDGGGYMGTTDFTYILSNIANKTLRDAYEAVPQTFKAFSRQTIAPDFKMMARLQLSDAPSLEKVNESGEFKRGSLTESKEKYGLGTYGMVIPISRQAIINDDLGVFTRVPAFFGKSAADLESDTVWNIITANAAMGDGIELFHTKHGNVSATGGAISIQSLGAAREALRKQKGLSGRFINVTAKYLIVPCALETQAQQFMATGIIYIKSPDVNPFAGTLQVIAEPRLDAQSTSAWYLSGDPSQIDTIEYAYLEGNEGAYLDSRVGFNVDGIEFKARLDFAAKAIDWRGFYRNSGSSS